MARKLHPNNTAEKTEAPEVAETEAPEVAETSEIDVVAELRTVIGVEDLLTKIREEKKKQVAEARLLQETSLARLHAAGQKSFTIAGKGSFRILKQQDGAEVKYTLVRSKLPQAIDLG